jgi:hypothetical protein
MMSTAESCVYTDGDEQHGDGNAVPKSARIVQRNGQADTRSDASNGKKRGKERFVDPTYSKALLVSAELDFMQAMND